MLPNTPGVLLKFVTGDFVCPKILFVAPKAGVEVVEFTFENKLLLVPVTPDTTDVFTLEAKIGIEVVLVIPEEDPLVIFEKAVVELVEVDSVAIALPVEPKIAVVVVFGAVKEPEPIVLKVEAVLPKTG